MLEQDQGLIPGAGFGFLQSPTGPPSLSFSPGTPSWESASTKSFYFWFDQHGVSPTESLTKACLETAVPLIVPDILVTLQYLLTNDSWRMALEMILTSGSREILFAQMRNATDLKLTILMLIWDVWLALAMILTGGFRAEESDAKGQVEQELKTFTFIDTTNFHQYDQLSSIRPTFINQTNFHK